MAHKVTPKKDTKLQDGTILKAGRAEIVDDATYKKYFQQKVKKKDGNKKR